MSSPEPQPSRTILTNLTRVVQGLGNRVQFSKLTLRKNARVPELWIQDGESDTAQVFPLLGDRYTIGRSSRNSDIVIRNPLVSQVHASIRRDKKHRRLFKIQDEKSTNGVFRKQQRIKVGELSHKDTFTLGPPDLERAVQIQFIDPPPTAIRLLRYALMGVVGGVGLLGAALALEWTKFSVSPLPASNQGPVVVLARDQTPLAQVRLQGHVELKSLSEFSPHVIDALLASEDSRFYWHFGIDPLGVARAVIANIRGGGIEQGASTLTQQLARSLYRGYVGTDDSIERKLREGVVALKLEANYSKDFILLNYLNKVYLGAYASGFEDAARFYFDKSAKDLSISEAATLAGILPAPNSFNPVQNYSAAVEYRNRVLSRMAAQGRITAAEAERARRSRIEISPKAQEQLQNTLAPYYYSYIFEELEELLGEDLAREGNFIVETGLSPGVQRTAEAYLENELETTGKSLGFDQGALITLDFRNGEILAMVGGKSYQESQFNRATQALRQPGSTFKLFGYAAALESGTSPRQTFSCAPLTWQGQTFSRCRSSAPSMDLATGLILSENAIALRVAQEVGLSQVIQLARRFGIQSTLTEAPGLVLGQSETTLLEMVRAYAVIANRGTSIRPLAIRKILDAGDCEQPQSIQSCRIIYDRSRDRQNPSEVFSPAIADTLTQILRGVVAQGTGRAAAIGLGAAGKTGTTDDNRDLWFIGFVPSRNLLTGIWLGNDNNQPTSGSSGQAAALWGKFMGRITR